MEPDPCKAETRCKDPTKTLEECPDKEDRMLATNPECTDAHQQSNPNKKNGCDSNMIPNATEGAKLNFGDEKNPSERYLKMRAYSLAQNCQYVGEAARTQGVKGGYNADALMIADPRKARDGRGIPDPKAKKDDRKENPVFRYPGDKTTAPSSEAGYGTEAEQYLERKSSEQDNLRQPDLMTISEFNANKNDTRTEVTNAALIKDPVCGALANRFDCKKSCTNVSRSQCMLLSSQCAYTEGLTCKKSVQRGKRCFKKVCNDKTLDFQKGQCPRAYTEMEADCEKEADAVTRSIPMESIQDCKDGEFCPGLCVHYEPTKKEGKIVVEGAKSYKRETKTECLDKEENIVQCRNGAAMNPDVVEERIVPVKKETCYGKDNKEVDCKDRERLRRLCRKDPGGRRQPVLPDPKNKKRRVLPRDADRPRRHRLWKVRLFRTGTIEDRLRLLHEEEGHVAFGVVLPEEGRHRKRRRRRAGVDHERRRRRRHRSTRKRPKNRRYLQTNWRDRYGYVQAKCWAGLASVARFGKTIQSYRRKSPRDFYAMRPLHDW